MAAKILSTEIVFQSESELYRTAFTSTNHSLKELNASKQEFMNTCEISNYEILSNSLLQVKHLRGRFAAKTAVSQLSKQENLSQIAITNNSIGEPLIVTKGDSNMCVSISHSRLSSIAIAFPSKLSIGIDLEEINSGNTQLLCSQYTKLENKLLDSHIAINETDVGVTLLWTAKEALAKNLKTGLTSTLSNYEIGDIIQMEDHFILKFINYPEVHAYSYRVNELIISLVFPCNFELTLNSENLYFSEKE